MLAVSDADNWIALGLSFLIVLYLVGVLIFPEKF